MTDYITVPGRRRPHLIRQCSPVVGGDPLVEGVVVDMYGGDPVVGYQREWGEHQTGRLYEARPTMAHQLELRLDHETGRDHAARYLWMSNDDLTERPCTAPEWLYCPDGVWSLGASVRDVPGQVQFTTYGPPGSGADVEVAALADLDPADPTLLPDGSRRVDALALRAVCLAVPR